MDTLFRCTIHVIAPVSRQHYSKRGKLEWQFSEVALMVSFGVGYLLYDHQQTKTTDALHIFNYQVLQVEAGNHSVRSPKAVDNGSNSTVAMESHSGGNSALLAWGCFIPATSCACFLQILDPCTFLKLVHLSKVTDPYLLTDLSQRNMCLI